MDRAHQSALPVQRRAQSGARLADPGGGAGTCRAGPRGGARLYAPAVAAGHGPVPADDAVPRAALRSAGFGHDGIARPHHLPLRAWRPDRRAACDDPRRDGRWPPGRLVDDRRARQRRDARRRRPRFGKADRMRRLTAAAFVLFGLLGSARAAEIADRFPGAEWEHVAPAAIGWSSDQLKAAEEWSGKI